MNNLNMAGQQRRKSLKTSASAFILALFLSAAISSAGPSSYIGLKKKLLIPIQSEFDRISKSYDNEAFMRGYHEKLALIDEIAELLAKNVQAIQSDVLAGILDGDAVPVSVNARSMKNKRFNWPSAAEIYNDHRGEFSATLPTPSIPKQELAILREYYGLSVKAATEYVQRQGKSIAAIDENAELEVAKLYMVILFLQVPDESWSSGYIDQLPEKIKTAKIFRAIEEFSLTINRPFSALQFAQYGQKNKMGLTEEACKYLFKTSTILILQGEYRKAIRCLKASIKEAEKGDDPASLMKAYVQLAQLYEQMGHPKLSAVTMKDALNSQSKTFNWGHAAMLRLKYLYKSGEFSTVLKESPKYLEDVRCQLYLPQLIYISWLSCKQEKQAFEADRLQQMLLSQFPEIPLCADMYFATAMSALAVGDYAKAERFLNLIEDKFPSCSIVL